jgi:hypothetical protein
MMFWVNANDTLLTDFLDKQKNEVIKENLKGFATF